MARASVKATLLLLAALMSGIALAAPGVYVEDDFSGDERYFFQGTLDDGVYTYHPEEGYYEINALESKSGALATITDRYSCYEVAAEVEFYDSAPRATPYAGIVFHYGEDERGRASFYVFAVFSDGYFGVWRVDREEGRSYVLPLKQTDLVAPASSNRLRIQAENSRFHLYLNDLFAGEFQDRALDSGGVGLYASAGSIVHFRRFRWLVEADETTGEVPANGPFGWLPYREYQVLFRDDFKQRLWREGELGEASLKYTDKGYQVDNSRGTTMALSYRSEPVADEGVLLALFRDLKGEERNGFGLAFAFRGSPGLPSYYAFVVARDATFKLFKTKEGSSEVLLPWQQLPFEPDFERPVMLAAGFIRELNGLRIVLGVNGRPVASRLDEEPLPAGGFALLAAPMLCATVSGVNLLTLDGSRESFRAKLDAWIRSQTTPEEDNQDGEAD